MTSISGSRFTCSRSNNSQSSPLCWIARSRSRRFWCSTRYPVLFPARRRSPSGSWCRDACTVRTWRPDGSSLQPSDQTRNSLVPGSPLVATTDWSRVPELAHTPIRVSPIVTRRVDDTSARKSRSHQAWSVTEIHADRSETVARQRYYQNENLHGGDPIREIRSVILEVVQLFLHVWFLGHALSKRPPAIAKQYPLCIAYSCGVLLSCDLFLFKMRICPCALRYTLNFFYHAITIK